MYTNIYIKQKTKKTQDLYLHAKVLINAIVIEFEKWFPPILWFIYIVYINVSKPEIPSIHFGNIDFQKR